MIGQWVNKLQLVNVDGVQLLQKLQHQSLPETDKFEMKMTDGNSLLPLQITGPVKMYEFGKRYPASRKVWSHAKAKLRCQIQQLSMQGLGMFL